MAQAPRKIAAIVDYYLGNLFSIQQAITKSGMEAVITKDHSVIRNADLVVLPGVGAFGDAMDALHQNDFVSLLREIASSGKPLLGICLGMQLFFSESEEMGRHDGLDIISGKVARFCARPAGREQARTDGRGYKIPHVGWNRVFLRHGGGEKSLGDDAVRGLNDGCYMYFMHSYYVCPEDPDVVLGTTKYAGIEYCSAVARNNLVGFQFHPERSGVEGLKIYQNMIARGQA